MSLRIAFRQWRQKPLLTGFVLLQVVVVLVLTVVTSVVLSDETQYYKAFSDYFRSDGILLEGASADIYPANSQTLEKKLRKAKVLSTYAIFAGIRGHASSLLIAYDPEIISRYQPELKDGVWLSDAIATQTVDTLHAVVAKPGINVGDILYAVTLDDEVVPIEVIGVLDPKAVIVGHPNGEYDAQEDYRIMYTDMGSVKVEGITILLNEDEVTAAQKTYSTLYSGMDDVVLIKYDKNISQKDADYNWQFILDNFDIRSSRSSMNEIHDLSVRDMKVKLYFLIPLLLACFVLMIVSAVCSNAITIRNSIHDYAVYNLCGMSWRKCILINLYYIVMNILLAGICVTILAPKIVHIYMDTTVALGIAQILPCIVVCVLYLILAMIQPYLLLKRQSAHNILVNHTGKGG